MDVSVRSNPNLGTIEFDPFEIHVCIGDIVRWHSWVGDPVVITFPGTPNPFGQPSVTLGAFEQIDTPVTGGGQACHDYGGKRYRKMELAATATSRSVTAVAVRDTTVGKPRPGPVVIVDY